MKLKCVFDENVSKNYDLVVGATFKRLFNETLSSGSLLISNVKENDRLANLHNYEYVYIYGTDFTFNKYFLVDTYNEILINVRDNIYEYTIALMSEAKLLEKFQMPNRVITHSLVRGQKKIREYIYEFCAMYVPKIKFTTDNIHFSYRYAFDFSALQDPTSDIYKKFNVLCPDMSFSKPTLRQALSQLMQVVGCLPTIENRVLSFLDLRAERTEFYEQNINYVEKSMSSDSYVNTIDFQGDNVLDDKNEIISESLGFRDRDNVYLKQEQNLVLETSKPIYEIYSFELCGYVNRTILISNQGGLYISVSDFFVSPTAGITAFTIAGNTDYNDLKLYNAKVIFCKTKNGGGIEEISTNELGTINALSSGSKYRVNMPSNTEYVIISGKDSADHDIYCNSFIGSTNVGATSTAVSTKSLYKKNITPLIVENSKRQDLNTDFLAMPSNPSSISELAQYYYATVGYSIGTKKISGFSQMYSTTNGFWVSTKTYIENIFYTILTIDSYGDGFSASGIQESFLYPFPISLDTSAVSIYDYNFANLFFNIKYRPQNSLNIRYFKDKVDIDMLIEQLDTQESSIPSFDELSSREKDKVNRLGVPVYSIPQRVNSLSEINPLNSVYRNKAIVFSVEYSIYKDFILVNYTASENYVIQNYFTSIQTKYRAYEYVDYNKSVVRKENKSIFVLIDDYYYNGDDNIRFGDFSTTNKHNEKSVFLSGAIKGSSDTNNLIYYTYESDIALTIPYKIELSSIVAKDILSFNYQEYDNASAGTYISLLTAQNGGLPQSWVMFPDTYYNEKFISFIGNINLANYYIYDNGNSIDNELTKIHNLPKVSSNVFTPVNANVPCIWLVDNNASMEFKYTDYKDYGEVMNRTLEFVFYTNNKFIKWTQRFIELCEFYDYDKLNQNNALLITTESDCNNLLESARTATSASDFINDYSTYIELNTTNKDIPYLLVKWGSIDGGIVAIKVVNKLGGFEYNDVIAFIRPYTLDQSGNKVYRDSDISYYITLNDTKSDKIFTKDNASGLYNNNTYVALRNTLNRKIGYNTNEFRTELVYFTEEVEHIEDFDTTKIFYSIEQENI